MPCIVGSDRACRHVMVMNGNGTSLRRNTIKLSDGFAMDLFSAAPINAPKATILLLSPIFGVDAVFAHTVRDWADAGYLAVAPDYFARVSPGTLPHTDEGFKRAIARVKAIDREQQLRDLVEIGSRYLGDPLFIGGYCAGGEPALRLALDGFGKGWVIFHAARLDLYADKLNEITGPLDIHFGGADEIVPPEKVERVRTDCVGKSNIHLTVHTGAVHGFTQRGSRNFHSAAASAAFAAANTTLNEALTAARMRLA
jgi:carboxymethylenebutenolidase